ncbi:hypothetical protein [Caudoviricetes sp.]|nr:hypothetical protein [Caudoviricetes sp.]UOF81902.1 hypothetical protein [Caudoviricetes sp.]
MNELNALLALGCINLLGSAAAIIVALRKRRGLSLTEIALRSIAYAKSLGTAAADFRQVACHAGSRLDASDNGKRDFTDAQIRIAIDAELHKHP